MLLLNFAHPLTEAQQAQVAALLGELPEVRRIAVQVDQAQPLVAQVRALVDGVGLSPDAWQTTPLVINPPGYAPAAAVVLAELHGRIGHFPAMVRLRPVADTTPMVYEVAEIINVQHVRETARYQRQAE
ncbi:hypothetical protein HC928_06690 [bacterium]|nr:hypothetical protein [bacterium]